MTHFSHDYEQGIKDERERIIELLETYIEAYGAPEEKIASTLFSRAISEIKGDWAGLDPSYVVFDEIKGEQK